MDRPWGMIKVSIFSFSIFGDFNEILVNSVLLSAFQYAASKKSVITDPNFISPKNHISIQVHMVHELFLSINLVLTALKLIKIGKFCTFYFTIYFPRIKTWKVNLFAVHFGVLYCKNSYV